GEIEMWNFIKCVFKFVFSLVAITTLVAGVGVVAFAYIFKKDFEDIERKTKEIISDIESKNN
ncbi:hypothetical protein MQI_01549, partial [Staphylococcus aureus subsp. aureus VRS5]